jgi:Putative cyclase
MTEAKRWKHRPEGSTWGDFGPDDEKGRLNLLTPAKVLEGIAEVRAGKAFCLSLPLDYPGGSVLNPRRHPPILRPTIRANGAANFNYQMANDDPLLTDVINDDVAILHLQYSTQWDSLAHVGQLFDADGDGKPEPIYYNGYKPGEHMVGPTESKDAGGIGMVEAKSTSYAHKLGVQNMAEACMQGRGVMIDLAAHFGRDKKVVGYDDLMRVMDKDKVEVQSGDMVCLHTSFSEIILEMGKSPDGPRLANSCSALDGRDQRLLQWITDSGLVALIADNYAVEAHPALHQGGCCPSLPLHAHCLFKLGVNLGEIWHLTPLAKWLRQEKRSRFLLTAPPLRLPGAVGSPATPIATV